MVSSMVSGHFFFVEIEKCKSSNNEAKFIHEQTKKKKEYKNEIRDQRGVDDDSCGIPLKKVISEF